MNDKMSFAKNIIALTEFLQIGITGKLRLF